MRTCAPRAGNGHRVGDPIGLPGSSVSICLRLEFIAILSGPLPGETFRRPVVMPFRPAAMTPPPALPHPFVPVSPRGAAARFQTVRATKERH